jgi:hypothetical protein
MLLPNIDNIGQEMNMPGETAGKLDRTITQDTDGFSGNMKI